MTRAVTPGLIRWLRSREHIEMLAESILSIVSCCRDLGLACRDPPGVASGLLQDLGYSQYRLRTFWSRLPLGESSILLYKCRGSSWSLILYHDRGPVCEVDCMGLRVPLDRLDCQGRDAVYSPNSHRLYLRVKGHVEGNMIEANVVRILYLIEEALPGTLEKVMGLLLGAAWGRSGAAGELVDSILSIVGRWRGILEFFLPMVPSSLEELERVSPVVRLLRSTSGSRG